MHCALARKTWIDGIRLFLTLCCRQGVKFIIKSWLQPYTTIIRYFNRLSGSPKLSVLFSAEFVLEIFFGLCPLISTLSDYNVMGVPTLARFLTLNVNCSTLWSPPLHFQLFELRFRKCHYFFEILSFCAWNWARESRTSFPACCKRWKGAHCCFFCVVDSRAQFRAQKLKISKK